MFNNVKYQLDSQNLFLMQDTVEADGREMAEVTLKGIDILGTTLIRPLAGS